MADPAAEENTTLKKKDVANSDNDEEDESRVRDKDTLFAKVREELVFHPDNMQVSAIVNTVTHKGWFTEKGSGKITPTLSHILCMDYPHGGCGLVTTYSVWMIHVEYLDCDILCMGNPWGRAGSLLFSCW